MKSWWKQLLRWESFYACVSLAGFVNDSPLSSTREHSRKIFPIFVSGVIDNRFADDVSARYKSFHNTVYLHKIKNSLLTAKQQQFKITSHCVDFETEDKASFVDKTN